MFEDSVYCENEGCTCIVRFSCEWEDAEDGSKHKVICGECGTVTAFEISYSPQIVDEHIFGTYEDD